MYIINPYNLGSDGIWLKGNLHAHTQASPCGHYPLEEVAATYSDRIMKYDFLAITDHLQLTDVSPVQGMNGLIMFSGTEYKKEVYQTLGININAYQDDAFDEKNHQSIFNEVLRQGGINIICHPHLYRDNYWPLDRLLELNGYTAIEIYNHNVKMNSAGRALATDLWDELLSRGRRVWGIASDDFHHSSRYGGGCIMVKASEKSPAAILGAIRAGSFYAAAGVFLKDIEVNGNIISLAPSSKRIQKTIFRFIGKEGKLLEETVTSAPEERVSYAVHGDEGYVRAEAYREDGARAWTAPFFIE
ncbi:MAG: CehA/McbA family metallohydrolase [Treponema sp.]|jgi:hypothetical protein|nr:CehA/McbA family metallohydrolase [Treponema sp.]